MRWWQWALVILFAIIIIAVVVIDHVKEKRRINESTRKAREAKEQKRLSKLNEDVFHEQSEEVDSQGDVGETQTQVRKEKTDRGEEEGEGES